MQAYTGLIPTTEQGLHLMEAVSEIPNYFTPLEVVTFFNDAGEHMRSWSNTEGANPKYIENYHFTARVFSEMLVKIIQNYRPSKPRPISIS